MSDMKSRLRELMNSTFKEEPRKVSKFESVSSGLRSTMSHTSGFNKTQKSKNSQNRGSLRFDFSLENYKKSSTGFNSKLNGNNYKESSHSNGLCNYISLNSEKSKSVTRQSSLRKKIDQLINDIPQSNPKLNYFNNGLNGTDKSNYNTKNYISSGAGSQSNFYLNTTNSNTSYLKSYSSNQNKSRDNSVNYSTMSSVNKTGIMQTKLRKEIELFSKALRDEKDNKPRLSYINRPPVSLDKPDLEMGQQNYLNYSPTKARKNSMVKGAAHIRNYTAGGLFKDYNQFNTQSTPMHSYMKFASSGKCQKTESDIDEFSRDLEPNPRRESYIEKYSPKKRRPTLEV